MASNDLPEKVTINERSWETMVRALKAIDDVAEAWRRDRRELKDEINWLHAELHGAELEVKRLKEQGGQA